MPKYLIILLLLSGCADKMATINNEINSRPYIAGKYNCQNYAIDKANALIKAGYSKSDMQFIITSYRHKDGTKEPHMVLNVNDWILDNTRSDIYPAPRYMKEGMNYDFWLKTSSLM